ncbi:MAG: aldo/keto reductase [Candidatus Kapabacteria bacterium]|nr:aldo/keto reductase [Candidatus Kapabacteria bacterium]
MDINSRIELNNGVLIPPIGLGVYLSKPGDETYKAALFALQNGYRHIDSAAFYRNEGDVGRAFRDSGLAREEFFVTTKLWNKDHGYDKALKAFEQSLKNLQMDYIDLYLIHWPVENLRKESWKALESLYEQKVVRSIGVSNYTIRHIKELLTYANVVPVVNQVEFSPFLYQKELQEFCMENKIYIEAYTPLTRGQRLNDPRLLQLAEKYGKTPAQILIRWTLQIGTITLPKSVTPSRILENIQVFDFELSQEDMEYMNSFNENFRTSWDPTNAP